MADTQRGKLKIFMGYAAGVGKTYKMLEEAQALRSAGVDVAVGYFEPHARKDTIAKTHGLEILPRRKVEYRGAVFEEMDTDAILSRHPQVCAVDEFPHTNVPGSDRAKRWEDVAFLLEAGIDVLTTMNIQHLESLNDQVFHITGIHVRETIPDWVVQRADEVMMMDLTPQALLNRLERGVVYAPDKAEQAKKNFFREEMLVALRELALRQAAHEVEQRIDNGHATGTEKAARRTGKNQKILALITADPETAMLIRRAKRVSDFLEATCIAITVQEFGRTNEAAQEAIDRHLNFARNLHVETHILRGAHLAEGVVEFARSHKITQIYLARGEAHNRWISLIQPTLIDRIVATAKDLQIVIVSPSVHESHSTRGKNGGEPVATLTRRLETIPKRGTS